MESSFILFHSELSNFLNFSKAKLRFIPGAIFSAICTASSKNVPLPHIGSRKGIAGFQPASCRIPAAKFSLSGASPIVLRKSLLNSASPDVSRYRVKSRASRNPCMRISGFTVFILGRLLVSSRNLSQTASLILKVTNSRLLSGHFFAATLTRIVFVEEIHSFHGNA